MSLLPLELQGLILSHLDDLEVINNLLILIPQLRPLAHDSIKIIKDNGYLLSLKEYVGSANPQTCRLQSLTCIFNADYFLTLISLPHLHTFDLTVVRDQEDFLLPLITSYFARHCSFTDLTLRCQTTKDQVFLLYTRDALFIDLKCLYQDRTRELFIIGVFFRWRILNPSRLLARGTVPQALFPAKSFDFIRDLDQFFDRFDLMDLMRMYEEINLILPSIAWPETTKQYNRNFSALLDQTPLDLINRQGSSFRNKVRILNLPFQPATALSLVRILNLESVGLFSPGAIRNHRNIELILTYKIKVTVFISDESEIGSLGTDPRIRYYLGDSDGKESYP